MVGDIVSGIAPFIVDPPLLTVHTTSLGVLISAIVTIFVGILIGTLAVNAGAQFTVDKSDYTSALLVATTGSILLVAVGWVRQIGPFLVLAGFLVPIKVTYDVGWKEAVGIMLIGWVALGIVYVILSPLGLGIVNIVGTPLVE